MLCGVGVPISGITQCLCVLTCMCACVCVRERERQTLTGVVVKQIVPQ